MHAVFAFQTTSKRKPDSFGTADTPRSTPISTATNFWYRSETGQPKTEKTDNKPTTSKMDGNLRQKEIMGMVHFLGSTTKIMYPNNIGNSIMTTLEDKIFTLKQNHLLKKMKEIHFLNHLISDSEKIILYPLSCEIINRTFTSYRNIELLKEKFSLSIKNEILHSFGSEENDIAYVYFYGGINDSAETPIELFPLFIIKIKNISNWLELINKPNFYCLKLFSNKIE